MKLIALVPVFVAQVDAGLGAGVDRPQALEADNQIVVADNVDAGLGLRPVDRHRAGDGEAAARPR